MNVTTEAIEAVGLASIDSPALVDPQAQGDLIILPWAADVASDRRRVDVDLATPVNAPIVVLTGNGGHDHTLSPAPGVAWHGYKATSQTLGVLCVQEGAVAVLGHIEHGDVYVGRSEE